MQFRRAILAAGVLAQSADAAFVRGAQHVPVNAERIVPGDVTQLSALESEVTALLRGATPANATNLEGPLIAALLSQSPLTDLLISQMRKIVEDEMMPQVKANHAAMKASLRSVTDSFSTCHARLSKDKDVVSQLEPAQPMKDCSAVKAEFAAARQQCTSISVDEAKHMAKAACEPVKALEKEMVNKEDPPTKAEHAHWKRLKKTCVAGWKRVKDAKDKCKSLVARWSSKIEKCDTARQSQVQGVCHHWRVATHSCQSYAACYERASSNFRSDVKSVLKREDIMRSELEAMLRIQCLLDVIELQQTRRRAAIEECKEKDYSKKSSSRFAITMPTMPRKDLCIIPADLHGCAAKR